MVNNHFPGTEMFCMIGVIGETGILSLDNPQSAACTECRILNQEGVLDVRGVDSSAARQLHKLFA